VYAGLINLFQSAELSHKFINITKPKGENDERCIKNRSGFSPYDMKKIMAGSGSSTNCQLCENGDIIYRDYDGSEPEDGCSWSTCPQIHP